MFSVTPDATTKPIATGSRGLFKHASIDAFWSELQKAVPKSVVGAWREDPISIILAYPEATVTNGVPDLSAWSRLFASVNVQVPMDICLVRDIAVPRAALGRADSILQMDLETTTPFRADEVFMGWYELPEGAGQFKSQVRQILIKRSTIQPLLERIKGKKLALRTISVLDNDGNELFINLLPASERSRAWLVRATSTGLKLAAALSIMVVLFAATLNIVNLRHDIETANSLVTEASASSQAVRKRLSDLESVTKQMGQPRLRKSEVVPVVAVWEELTSVLPQSTWLNEVRIEESTVQIDGQSANASELIATLARSPIFTNVSFASPVTRDAQRGFERFQIRLQAVRTKPGAQ